MNDKFRLNNLIPETPLGFLNFYILQWFFIRLARVGYIDMEDGKFKQTGWQWLKGVYPLTGWWNDYKWRKK